MEPNVPPEKCRAECRRKGTSMLFLILLIVLLLAAVPAWPYSRGWGYYPSGALGTILLILIVLMLIGYIPF
jgi:hypothetical protein